MYRQGIWICSILMVFHYVTANFVTNGVDIDNNIEGNVADGHFGLLTKCSLDGGFASLVNCAASRALKLLHHVAKSESLTIFPGVSLISNKPLSQRDAKEIVDLPKELSEKADFLLDYIVQEAGRIFSGRSIKIDIPEVSPSTIERSLEEGRGKLKKGGSSLMYIIGAKILLIKSLLMAVLKFMSVKALILAKVALVISAVLAAQTLFGRNSGVTPYFSGVGLGSGWNSGNGPVYGAPPAWTTNSIGGWTNSQYPYARSINVDGVNTQTEAQDLAYTNQKP